MLKFDSTNVEAIACIGTHHFYTDQPEIALRFYRCVHPKLSITTLPKYLLYSTCFNTYTVVIISAIPSRRLLQMGVYSAELFTNLGLCCFYAQQYDMTLNCFQRALDLASDENSADVWYNIGHVALVRGVYTDLAWVGLLELKIGSSGTQKSVHSSNGQHEHEQN